MTSMPIVISENHRDLADVARPFPEANPARAGAIASPTDGSLVMVGLPRGPLVS
jgi:hypothetical protein